MPFLTSVLVPLRIAMTDFVPSIRILSFLRIATRQKFFSNLRLIIGLRIRFPIIMLTIYPLSSLKAILSSEYSINMG